MLIQLMIAFKQTRGGRMKILTDDIILELDEESLRCKVRHGQTTWQWDPSYQPTFTVGGETIAFSDAREVSHAEYTFGLGKGIRSRFSGFSIGGEEKDISFETLFWIEETTKQVHCEWVPLKEESAIEVVNWPGEMQFDEMRDDWYTLLPFQQGLLIPNTWPTSLEQVPFDGRFNTSTAYMPWYAQVKGGAGYLATCLDPADAGYTPRHEAGKPALVGMRFFKSLGSMRYRRRMQYEFFEDCDYNDIAKAYRKTAREAGKLITLRQKQVALPQIEQLIGTGIVHVGIKTYVREDSRMYDKENPEKNNRIVPFAQRAEEMKKYSFAGVRKLYLHLDGWAEPGYDNQHPDYLPACEEAGGWAGMRDLAKTVQSLGFQFGIHDQYRDYYFSAPSFDESYATRLEDGTIPTHANWAGGKQTYLCTTQALSYVKRNFSEIAENGIRLDGAYLDVFTCNEGDECFNPEHRMSRAESFQYRGDCFQYLVSQGIMPSSEEVNDWAMKNLVFCHYAPYDFMLRKPGSKKYGVPVPLFNLVYHDCVIEPWVMEKFDDGEDYMLYALLNGGVPYLRRDGAYFNIDGAYDTHVKMEMQEEIDRCFVVSLLNEKIANRELVKHGFDAEDWMRQYSIFADGTRVDVDLRHGTYEFSEIGEMKYEDLQ